MRIETVIAQNIAEGVYLVSASDLRIVYANRRMEEMFGYGPGELTGQPVSVINATAGGNPEKTARRIEESVKRTGTWRGEVLNVRKDGTPFWGYASITKAHDSGFGDVYVSLQTDISEHKRADQALRESEERFRTITEHIEDLVYTVDPRGMITFASPACARVFGFTPDEMRGHQFTEFLVDTEIPKAISAFTAALSTGQTARSLQLAMRRKDGSVFTGELRGTLRWEGGSIAGTIGLIRDITDRVRSEAAMQLAAKEWQATFDAVSDGIWLMNANQQVLRSNKAGADLFHCSVDEVEQRECWETTHGTTMPVDCPFVRMRQSRRRETLELEQNGRWLTISVDPVFDDAGQLLGAVHITSDTTDRHRLQTEFLQAQKMESIGRLAGGIAHDFNNMLAVILGHLELALEQMEPAEPLHDVLTQVQSAAQRSATLTRQLLGFARRQPILPRRLNLNDTISQMTAMIERLVGDDVDLVWKPSAELWPVKVDPNQIDQILANLSVNARDAIAGMGRIVVETSNVTLTEADCAHLTDAVPGDYVAICVSDNGCGMPSDVLEHIYEPFFTTKGIGEGTGLGLATVHGIVRQNRGIIDVESQPGAGTTFTIYLPRHAAADQAEALATMAQAPKGRGETVLLVEDQREVLDISRAILERLGYAVLTADSPADAIRQASAKMPKIDLLLTDVEMPHMSGWKLAEHLKQATPGLPCVFMTGYAAQAVSPAATGENVQVIQKPFSAQNLAVKIRRALQRP